MAEDLDICLMRTMDGGLATREMVLLVWLTDDQEILSC